MNRRWIFSVMLILFTGLVLAACGGDSDDEDADDSTPTAVDSGEASEDNVQLIEPIELSEEYTTENGRYTIRHPEGWVFDDRNSFFGVFSNDGAKNSYGTRQPFEAGEVAVIISFTSDMGGAVGTPAEHITWYFPERPLYADGFEYGDFSDPLELIVNGVPAATKRASSDKAEVMHVSILSYEAPNEDVLGYWTEATLFTATGELNQWEATFLEMTESITGSPPGAG